MKYIKDKDGKFAGSVGDGRDQLPTTTNTPPAISQSDLKQVETSLEQALATLRASTGIAHEQTRADLLRKMNNIAVYEVEGGGFIAVTRDDMPQGNPRWDSSFVMAEGGRDGVDETGIADWRELTMEGRLEGLREAYPDLPIVGFVHTGWDEFRVIDDDTDYADRDISYLNMRPDGFLVSREYDMELEDAVAQAKDELESYGRYVRGDYYRVTVYDDNGEELDSLGGWEDDDPNECVAAMAGNTLHLDGKKWEPLN